MILAENFLEKNLNLSKIIKAISRNSVMEDRNMQKITLNTKQKLILKSMAAIMAIMLIYVPWHDVYVAGNGASSMMAGYDLIFTLSKPLDTVALLTQWLGVGIVGGIVLIINND